MKEKTWRSSIFCFSAFQLFLWFTLQEQLLLILLSLCRFLVVIHPVESRFKRSHFTSQCVCSIIVGTFVVSISLTNFLGFYLKSLPTSLCLPFVDPTHRNLVVKLLVWFNLFTQTTSSASVTVLHVMLVHSLLLTQQQVTNSKTKQTSNTSLYVQLSMLSISCLCCSYSASGVFLSTLFLETYPMEMITGVILGCVPINSLLYPLILFVSSAKSTDSSGNKTKLEGQPITTPI